MVGSLTDAQVESYWNDGFLFPVPVMTSAEAAAWRTRLEAFTVEFEDDPLYDDYVRANFHVVSTAAAELAHLPAIVDAVESVLGPDLLCWMAELFVKPAHTATYVSMHQDLAYWGFGEIDGEVSAWVALGDVSAANGAMRFVPRSHRRGLQEHADTFAADNLLSRGQEITEHDPTEEVPVELAAGEVSLHHGLMVHGSGPNTSTHDRYAIVLRYVAADVAKPGGAEDYGLLVRGSNRGALVEIPAPHADCDDASRARHALITGAQAAFLGEGAGDDLSYSRRT